MADDDFGADGDFGDAIALMMVGTADRDAGRIERWKKNPAFDLNTRALRRCTICCDYGDSDHSVSAEFKVGADGKPNVVSITVTK